MSTDTAFGIGFEDSGAVGDGDVMLENKIEKGKVVPIKQPRKPRFQYLSADDMEALPPERWLIKKVLPEKGMACIWGPSGAGKSFLVLDIAGAISSGRSWFGKKTMRTKVIYLCLEGHAGFRKRCSAYRSVHGRESLDGVRFVFCDFDLTTNDPSQLVDDIIEMGYEPGTAVIIDTLNRAAPGVDENSASDISLLLKKASVIQSRLDGLLIFVHHSGKDVDKGERGTTAIRSTMDISMSVSKGRDGSREWSVKKEKDEQEVCPESFVLERVVLGMDEDGDEISSCVVRPVDSDGLQRQNQPPTKKTPALKKNQRLALDHAKSTIGDRSIHRAEFLTGLAQILDCEPKRRRERASEAIESLIVMGMLSADGDLLSMQ